ncbi:efflux RND transporter periplasmic adaptor subunit [Arcobacter sp. L]|uniref:efflux RND transporter periplasmic adaptor subunit n=1 Tax=Arcobacter sp. L TaxID=944547 RepID=UPI000229636A|nr:efflux RND transporter periplasmic adaptor subunit [Arcobacter sp. L]BAK74108.1 efflux transport protein [Arcobacter sp. L]
MIKILLIGCLLFFTACQKKEENKKQESKKSVFVIKPTIKDGLEKRIFNAVASSSNETKLSFKVQGNLNYFKIQIGDEVKENSLIAKLDSKPYELKVSQVNYALSESLASLQNAKNSYERVKKLYINQNASVSDIDNARSSFEASKAKVENIKKELEYAKLQLSYTELYSPINGVIGAKFVNENENVTVGTPIVLVSDKFVDEVRIHIPEMFINKIKKEDFVKVFFNSINTVVNAKISEISKVASSNEKTYLVIVKLEEKNPLIKVGMSADVYFNFEEKGKKLVYLIPSNSVLNDKDGYFVYVIEKNGNDYFTKRKNIKVGNLQKEGYEVISGLNENDLVLKAGMSEVFEGMAVVIGNEKAIGN